MVLTQRRPTLLRRSIVISLALILALSAYPHAATATTLAIAPVQISAASVGKDVRDVVKQTQALKIDGSQLMEPINQALKESFEQAYPGTDVTIGTNGTEPALDALLNRDIDLAAIGRSLSAAEKAKGLVEIPVSQDAISIIIGRNNGFNGHLTLEQFAQIFRGEITNWSEVGGTPGPIRFIDRPLSSDTRAVLSTYGIVGAAEQAQGERVVTLKSDDTAEVIRQLGGDGISYAIASQVKGQRRVKAVTMAILQDTLPGEQAYPYSQVRGYAYKKDNATAVLPFVNWLSGEAGKASIGAGKTAEAAAIATALSPAAAQGAAGTSFLGGLWWLLGLLPLPLLFLLGRRREPANPVAEPVAAMDKVAERPPVPEPKPLVSPSVAEPPVAPKPVAAPPPTPVKPPTPTPPVAKPPVAKPPAVAKAAPVAPPVVAAPKPTIPTPPKITTPLPPVTKAPVVTKPVPTLVGIPFEQTAGWNDANTVSQKGFDYIQSEQASKAEAYFRRALELSPKNILGLLGLGSVCLAAKQGDNALTQFNLATEVAPDNIDGWIGKGKALTLLGQADAALGDLDRALQLNKTSTDALKAKGDAFLALGQLDEANRYYGEANALLNGAPIPIWKPSARDAQVVMVTSTSAAPGAGTPDAGAAEPAVETVASPPAVTNVIVSEPTDGSIPLKTIQQLVNWNDADAVCQKGLYYQSLGRSHEAEHCFRRVLELSPANVVAVTGLGRILLNSGQPEPALTLFDQAVELDPNLAEAWIGHGDALVALGQPDKAKHSYARAWSMAPEATPASAPRRPAAPPASFVAQSAPQLLDMVILVDSQVPTKTELTEMQAVMADAISSTTRPTDVRVTWLGNRGEFAGSPVSQTVAEYLGRLGKSPGATPGATLAAADAIAAVTQHFDWRPGAAQSLLYLGHETLHGNGAVQSVVQTANQTGTIVSTYLFKVPTTAAAATAEYDAMAMATGGLAFVKDGNVPGRDVLGQTMEQSCRECIYRRLTIRSSSDSLTLDQAQLTRLQSQGNGAPLSPGKYIIRINSGTFSYWPDAPTFEPEPWVMLWIYGGRFINQATNVEVGNTWVTLNGYDDVLKLEVLEETHFCALFLDTYKDDNVGQVVLSVVEAG